MTTIYDLPSTPQRVSMGLRANTARYTSPLTGTTQTVARGGEAWVANLTWNALHGADRAEMMALIAELRGQTGRVRVPAFDNPARGAYGGTPVSNGNFSAGATQITASGCTASVTNWIRRGDFFSIVVNGEPELKICTQDRDSNGAGNVFLDFYPALRAGVAVSDAVWVQDGVLQRPQGVFMQAEAETNWQSTPAGVSSFTLSLIEDLLATQA